MGNALMNLPGFKKGPAAAFRGHETDESLADGIGGGYPLIRYGGKNWALQLRGDVIQYTGPDGYQAPYIDVVILRQARNKSKAYFPNYEEGTREAPVCSSLDGIVPDPGVEDRQAATCAVCPRNVFKKNEKGMTVKECSDAKRLAVFPLIPAHMLKLTGGPVTEPTFLRVPAASMQPLAQMGDNAKKAGYEFFHFVTRIDFDPEKTYPKMRFTAHQALDETEAEAVLKLREDPQAYRICSGELGSAMKTITPPTEPVQGAPRDGMGVGDPAQAALAAKFEADRLYRLAQAKADAAAKEASQVKPTQVIGANQQVLELKANPPEDVDAGLAGLTTDQEQGADTGEPDQADAALDAAIEAFLPKS